MAQTFGKTELNKYTPEDLKTMQEWSFERKIMVTQTRIQEWYQRFDGKVAVNFSGGVDSTVLLDLSRRCYPDIPAVFVDTGLEWPEVREFALSKDNVTVLKPQFCKTCTGCSEGCFAKIVKAHGWNFPSKDVAMSVKYARRGSKWAINRFKGLNADDTESPYKKSIYGRWAFLVDSPFPISNQCCQILKERPLDKWHKETGRMPIVGTLASESRRRRNAWLLTGCNAFDAKKQISKPLSFWRQTDILRYLRQFNISYASIYGEIIEDGKGGYKTTGAKQTGCSLCPTACHLDKTNKYQRMKETHPDLWDFGINTLGLGKLLDFVGVDYGRDCECQSD
jgi:3'-phosphoadenosine 5'-phosphosulfate sulfotransferase (PAPS reductase)/FAD synthetase